MDTLMQTTRAMQGPGDRPQLVEQEVLEAKFRYTC